MLEKLDIKKIKKVSGKDINKSIAEMVGNVHETMCTGHMHSDVMDEERKSLQAYEYLCRVEEAKIWLSNQSGMDVEELENFEDQLSKGIVLAKIAKRYNPENVGKIFMEEEKQYRHTDNINYFLSLMKKIKLPKIFYFGVLDCYEKKFLPNVIFCIHALAQHMNKIGLTENIKGLSGKIQFSDSQLSRAKEDIKDRKMPEFKNISAELEKKNKLFDRSLEKIDVTEVEEPLKEDFSKNQILENIVDSVDHYLKIRKIKEDLEEKIKIKKIEDSITAMIKDKRNQKSVITIQKNFKVFLYSKSLDEIIYKKEISVFSLRRFLFVYKNNTGEIEKDKQIELLHEKIVGKILDTNSIEEEVEDQEASIALLLKNKVSSSRLTRVAPEKPTAINHDTSEFKVMQQVFGTLQKRTKYFASLLISSNKNVAEEIIREYMLPIFYNQKSKGEEYTLYKLISEIINLEEKKQPMFKNNTILESKEENNNEEIATKTHHLYSEEPKLQELKSFVCTKVTSSLFFQGIDSSIFERFFFIRRSISVDSDCDPSFIYFEIYGKRVEKATALEDERVKGIYIKRLKKMKRICIDFLNAIENSIDAFPFFFRQFFSRISRFKMSPVLFYSQFLMPILVNPDYLGEKVKITNASRASLTKVSDLIVQMIRGFPPADYFYPLKNFALKFAEKYMQIFKKVHSVKNFFGEENAKCFGRPVVELKPSETNRFLSLLKENIDKITEKEDTFRELVVKASFIPEDDDNTINFQIEPDSPEMVKRKIKEIEMIKEDTIRLLLACSGRSIKEILNRGTTREEEFRFTGESADLENNEEVEIRLPEKNKRLGDLLSCLNDDTKKIFSDTLNTVMAENGRSIVEEESIIEETSSAGSSIEQINQENQKEDLKISKELVDLTETNQKLKEANNHVKQLNASLSFQRSFLGTLDLHKDQLRQAIEREFPGDTEYTEILNLIAQDIYKLKIGTLGRDIELKMNQETYRNLEQKLHHLQEKQELLKIYLSSYINQMSRSTFKTYNFSTRKLKENKALLSIMSGLELAKFTLRCIKPNHYRIEAVHDRSMIGSKDLFLDKLLKMEARQEESVEFNGIGTLGVRGMIGMINKKYIIE